VTDDCVPKKAGSDIPQSQDVALARKIRVLDMINTDQCARELLDHRVAQVNATGRYENAICCSSGEYVEKLRVKGHTVYVLDTPRRLSPIGIIVAMCKAIRLFRKERFDIVHLHGCVVGLIGRLAALIARTPYVIYQAHGFYHHEGMCTFKQWVFIKAEQLLSIFADKLLFQNPTSVDDTLDKKIAPGHKLVLIGNGIQLDVYRCDQEPDKDPPLIVYVALMEERKNHLMLFKAAAILKDRGIAFKVMLAGDGRLQPQYEKWVSDHALDEYIEFLGYREDIPDLIKRASICVLVSVLEGIPRAVIEASAAGRVVVATDVVGTRNAVKDGETGFLVPYDDFYALADKIEQLLSNEELLNRIGRQAREYACENYDERVVVERIIKVYDDLAGKG